MQIYDVNRRTCLRTDWSKSGIGYLLSQKHCECHNGTYGCCPDGWRITLAGSRFLSKTEMNYSAVEGEALAFAWALHQTKFFTMGCNDLLVIVDHKPLLGILGDQRLDEIENPRLFRLKMKTLRWKYQIQYQRGSRNPFADAMSRYPTSFAELGSIQMDLDGECGNEELFIDSICTEVQNVVAITWKMVKEETAKDPSLLLLKGLILDGFPSTKSDLDESVQHFWDVREHLSVWDSVLLYKDRIIIPGSLLSLALINLHSAHQGVSSMLSRVQCNMYWPGMTTDIQRARAKCRTCDRNAPSQVKCPPIASDIPTTPFEMIASDFFDLHGSTSWSLQTAFLLGQKFCE